MSAPNNQNFFIINNTNAWKFDGGFPCGPRPTGTVVCNGVIENTANGTNLANQTWPVKGFDTSGATGAIEIVGLDIRNLYVHTPPIPLTSISTNGTTTGTLTCVVTCGFVVGETGIAISDSSIPAQNVIGVTVASTSGTSMTVTYPTAVAPGTSTVGNAIDVIIVNDATSNCVASNPLLANLIIHDGDCHDVAWGITATGDTPSNGAIFEVYNMDLYNLDHDLVLGGTNTNASYTAKFHDNHLHNWKNWNNGTPNYYHFDGLHFFNNWQQAANVYVYNNLIDQWDGINNTSPLFNQQSLKNTFVFNNVIICSTAQGCTNAPPLHEGGAGQNQLFLNNTFIGSGVPRASGSGSANNVCVQQVLAPPAVSGNGTMMNNVITGCHTMVATADVLFAANTATTGLDYNLYANRIPDGNKSFNWTVGTTVNTTDVFGPASVAGSWQALSGEGTHSSFIASAGIDASGVPQSGSAAIGKATNLSSLCTGNLVALCSDTSAGNTRTPVARPTTGAWDIGAFQFVASGAAPVATLSTISIQFFNQMAGTTTSLPQLVRLTNTGSSTLSITSISVIGTNAADFPQSNDCGTSVLAGGFCTITITFSPSVIGPRSASVSIVDNAAGSPHSIALSGNGMKTVSGTGRITGTGVIKVQ
jgi:hypothetical protein